MISTWAKFQIDYIERERGITMSDKEKEVIAWFLELPKSEQAEVIKIERQIKNEIKNNKEKS